MIVSVLCEAALSDRQTKLLIVAGRTSKVAWTRDDTIKAFGQGWGLFSERGNKVMRVLRSDGTPIIGIDLKPRMVFGTDELARAWVKRHATAGYRSAPPRLGTRRKDEPAGARVKARCRIAGEREAVSRPKLPPRMVCTSCGIIGAFAWPNWQVLPSRESLTGRQWN